MAGLPGAGGRIVAAENLGAVGTAGGGGAVGVQGNFPAPLVDRHVVVEEAVQGAPVDAGGAAVGQVGQMVHFARRGGLVAAPRMLLLSTQEAEQASWMTC
jgi:hypothetical protein